MDPALPTDGGTNRLFDQVAVLLREHFGYSEPEAVTLTREYYMRFRGNDFCEALHIPVQDDDFFHHQGPGDLAWRVHYYLGLKADPDPRRYIEWRSAHLGKLRG